MTFDKKMYDSTAIRTLHVLRVQLILTPTIINCINFSRETLYMSTSFVFQIESCPQQNKTMGLFSQQIRSCVCGYHKKKVHVLSQYVL